MARSAISKLRLATLAIEVRNLDLEVPHLAMNVRDLCNINYYLTCEVEGRKRT